MKKKIGIVVLATNSYFILGLRFIKRFQHFYKGEYEIVYYFFSDEDPSPYAPNLNIRYYNQKHTNWRDGTNSKFKNIVNIQYELRREVDYVYYFDADTNIDKPFTEEWFLGDMVGGEHYGNRDWLANGAGFDRNPVGHSYIPYNTGLPSTYMYGAFFGGTTENMIKFCQTLYEYQIIDQSIGYEPPNNDEGYINAYFHFNPPTYTVPTEKFGFLISDKGGYHEDVRYPETDISIEKKQLLENKDKIFNIVNKNIVYDIGTNTNV